MSSYACAGLISNGYDSRERSLIPMTLKISAKYDGSLIRVGGSERYLLFKIVAEASSTLNRVPLNLSLVLDRSGSMSGENKLELVKQAAAFVVQRLSDQDRVNVIAYDDEIRVVSPSVKATAANRQVVAAEIGKLHTGGSTNLGEGWLTGCRQVAEFQTEARYIDCAWLLTDGLANVGIVSQEELTTHATELRKRGISTTTFGVGLDFNEDLLRAMAEKGGGNFYFIDSSKQVKNYFEGELGERLNTVARGLALQIQFPEGVSLDCVNDYETSRGSSRVILQLGDMYAGEERQVLVKVTTPAHQTGEQVKLSALLMFTTPQTGAGHEASVTDNLTLTCTSEQECNAQVIEAELKEIIGKLLVSRARQEILAANRIGDYAGVESKKRAFFQSMSDADLDDAPAVQKELEELEQFSQEAAAAPLRAEQAKEAHFRSHMTSRSRKDYKR